ncbi:serine/threonine protein kinase [Streptosporangium album]|uniref:Serine/threonine protein kinase n=1 Tax=Streptosporangium album TaxID=47479 RepID=A0A7W7WAV5_9ACTN|nr:serine/threonine-protein kinase [Streptosporangium album]MBB4940842.1 serine/threonine protein kinase [Streptosporangium album]
MDRVIGPYRVVRGLGQGGTGEVFLARDPDGRQVVVKLIHPHLAAGPAFRQRFQQEAEAASRTARSCIAPVVDTRLDGDQAYLVTEYVDGPDLRRRVEGEGPLAGSALDTLAVSTAVALQAVHAAGVVHRNLKPSTVLLGPLGPRVIGFGVAHLTGQAGAPGYVSPEEARGEEVGTASDVFAWGGIVLYAATGRTPSGGGTGLYGDRVGPGLTGLHGAEPGPAEPPGGSVEPDLTGLHGPLRELAGRALAWDPAHRPSVQDILRILTGAADPATSLASRPAPPNPQEVRPPALPAVVERPAPRPPTPAADTPATQWRRSVALPLAGGVAVALVVAGISFFLPDDGAAGDRRPPTPPAVDVSGTAQPTGSPSAPTTPSPSPSSTPATAKPTSARTLPFLDDFTGPNSGWTVAARGRGKHRPVRGAYRLVASSDDYLPVIAPVSTPVGNTTITAKLQMLGGKGTFGVFCRGMDKGSRRYEFSITSDGDASIVKSGEAPATVKRVRVPGYDPARLVSLQATCRGGTAGTSLSLRVNGRQVVSRIDRKGPLASGSIGMFAHASRDGSGVDVSFNSFEALP